MNILIVEDESLAADRLQGLIEKTRPDVNISGKTGSVKDSIKWLRHHKADLIFLDIQLSDGISFSIFEQVETEAPIIFTTAYDQYAIKAFQLNSIAYLLKPVRKQELEAALSKFEKLQKAPQIDFEQILMQLRGEQPGIKQRFLINFGDKIIRVNATDIAYFYAYDKGVYLRTWQNSSYPVDFSLDSLEQKTDPEKFFRINRKYLVHLDSIAKMKAWSRSRVKLTLNPPADDDLDTIVSIERSGVFKKWLDK